MAQVENPSFNTNGGEAAKPTGQAGGWGGAQPALTLPGGRAVNPWLVLISIMLGFFMSLLDATITNIALTNIQTNLKTDLTTVSWVINAYSIAFAALLVTMGRFADQFGRKRVFMTGMIIFSLSSLLCAIAPTIEPVDRVPGFAGRWSGGPELRQSGDHHRRISASKARDGYRYLGCAGRSGGGGRAGAGRFVAQYSLVQPGRLAD